MRFLIVDNMQEYRELLVTLISSMVSAPEFAFAASGREAIERLVAGWDPDLVVADYVMDDGDGIEIYRHLKKTNPLLPFVLFTSWPNPELGEFTGDEALCIVEKHQLSRLRDVLAEVIKDKAPVLT